MSEEDDADHLRIWWERLSRAHEALARESVVLHGSHDLNALKVHGERLRLHGAELRGFAEQLEAFHAQYRRPFRVLTPRPGPADER